MGATPVRAPLSSGQHSVVFVHPSLGKKTVSVDVSPGKSAVAAVRF
jgi:serine/threonine-protein kinase